MATVQTQALSLEDLPFIASTPASNIRLPQSETDLMATLVAELKQQHKTNAQLKLYKTQRKIALYERKLLLARLRAEGYYASDIKTSVTETIEHLIAPGPSYKISALTWPPTASPLPESLIGLQIGAPIKAEQVLKQKSDLAHYIRTTDCFYEVSLDYQVNILHQSASAEITFTLAPSQRTEFGEITIAGNGRVKPDFIRHVIDIDQGGCFQRAQLDRARLALLKTNLLASVDIVEGEVSDQGVPVAFTIKERHQRSLSAGLSYNSEFGLGVITGWQHRNLLGRGEQASVQLYLAQNKQTLDANVAVPNFLRPGQTLNLFSQLDKQDTDAYQSETASLGAALARSNGRHLRADVGVQLDLAKINDDGEEEDYALFSLPANLEYDRRDNLLDPRNGWLLRLSAQPFWHADRTSDTFLKNSAAAHFYYTFEQLPLAPTLALRAAIGSISGARASEVPAPYRFYVGGGGSVRGYPYQSLGAITDNEPDGGLSYTEYALESRLHFSKSWGMVVFMDGGYAYQNEVPEVGEDLLWGAGLGLRYYTSFAPIRFDIGIPLDKRPGTDDNFQVYISIGQAF